MEQEIIESEKQMIKSNIHMLTKRLDLILGYLSEQKLNIDDKKIFTDLIIEIANNIETETKNYTFLF